MLNFSQICGIVAVTKEREKLNDTVKLKNIYQKSNEMVFCAVMTYLEM